MAIVNGIPDSVRVLERKGWLVQVDGSDLILTPKDGTLTEPLSIIEEQGLRNEKAVVIEFLANFTKKEGGSEEPSNAGARQIARAIARRAQGRRTNENFLINPPIAPFDPNDCSILTELEAAALAIISDPALSLGDEFPRWCAEVKRIAGFLPEDDRSELAFRAIARATASADCFGRHVLEGLFRRMEEVWINFAGSADKR